MSRITELHTLRARTLAVEKRLASLQRRLKEFQEKPRSSRFKAVIDQDKCIHCGRCQGVCPAGAMTINGDVRIDPTRCVGCGRCAAECPKGAISLRPAGMDIERQVGPPGQSPGTHSVSLRLRLRCAQGDPSTTSRLWGPYPERGPTAGGRGPSRGVANLRRYGS